DLLRQAPAGAGPERLGQMVGSSRAFEMARGIRSCTARSIVRPAPAARGVSLALGGRLRGDERGSGRRRSPPRAMAAVLGPGLPGGTAARVRVSRKSTVDLLQRGIWMGVQRGRHS